MTPYLIGTVVSESFFAECVVNQCFGISRHLILRNNSLTFLFESHFSGLFKFTNYVFYISVVNSDRLITLIATDTNTMLVFEVTSLKWAAQLPFTPLIIKRGTFSVSIIKFF